MITLGTMIKASNRGIFSVNSQQTVLEALQFMADKNIGEFADHDLPNQRILT